MSFSVKESLKGANASALLKVYFEYTQITVYENKSRILRNDYSIGKNYL